MVGGGPHGVAAEGMRRRMERECGRRSWRWAGGVRRITGPTECACGLARHGHELPAPTSACRCGRQLNHGRRLGGAGAIDATKQPSGMPIDKRGDAGCRKNTQGHEVRPANRRPTKMLPGGSKTPCLGGVSHCCGSSNRRAAEFGSQTGNGGRLPGHSKSLLAQAPRPIPAGEFEKSPVFARLFAVATLVAHAES